MTFKIPETIYKNFNILFENFNVNVSDELTELKFSIFIIYTFPAVSKQGLWDRTIISISNFWARKENLHQSQPYLCIKNKIRAYIPHKSVDKKKRNFCLRVIADTGTVIE